VIRPTITDNDDKNKKAQLTQGIARATVPQPSECV